MHIMKKDSLWFLIAALMIMSLLTVPNWVGTHMQNDQLAYRGMYADLTDYSVYLSMMRSGEMGAWMYTMRFTNEALPPAFVRMFYVLLGHISGWTGLSVVAVYEIARWLFGIAALYAIYILCNSIFQKKNLARAAFLLISLGSGVGWLQLMVGVPLKPISPIDFWLIDAYVFFSTSLFPAFSYSLITMAFALKLFLDYFCKPKWNLIAAICALAVTCQITNPIAFVVVDLAFVGAVSFNWLQNKKLERHHILALFVIALAQIPLLVYNFSILVNNPLWNVYTAQNQTLSPPPSFYFWGFLPFWFFALPGILSAAKRRDIVSGALVIWVVSAFALAYSPVAIQRRFLLGVTIPLGILAVIGFEEISNWAKLSGRKNLLLTAYVSVASISTLYFLLGSSLNLMSLPANHFYPRELQQALTWLNQHARPNDLVLSSKPTGELIAQYTHLRVYLGHEIETLYFERKTDEVTRFFNNQMDAGWAENTSADWVFYGPYEKELSGDFSFAPGEVAYKSKNITIYEIKHK